MYDLSSLNPPSLTPEKPKPPILGILSCAAALLAGLLFCAMFLIAYSVGSHTMGATDLNYQQLANLGYGFLGLICGSSVSALAGIILGIVSVVRKNPGQAWGIVGIVLNAVILLGYCLFLVLGVMASRAGI